MTVNPACGSEEQRAEAEHPLPPHFDNEIPKTLANGQCSNDRKAAADHRSSI